ncbi:MAG TPA: hypothetical protein VM943_07970, partial [Pyrinomonadaceae bacterium]|nr:hypothetical protein [Pyrinomonadaceae bacterium]
DRVPGTERNSFRTPNVYQFDARITRNFRITETARLRLILEGFNIFNRANIETVNSNFFRNFTAASTGGVNTLTLNAPFATAVFDSPRTFLTQRQLQLAIKFDF